MIDLTGFVNSSRRTARLVALAVAAASMISVTEAQVILSDGNSQATVNLGPGTGALGMNSWTINGQNQLAQQWFWMGVGGAAQAPINSGSTLTFANTASFLTATYIANAFTVRIDYTLTGGQTGGSDWTSQINESINILNSSAANQTYHFFQYSDFNLLGSGANDTVHIGPGSVAGSWRAQQFAGASQLAETVDLPIPNHSEAAYAGYTLGRLNGGTPITLNDNLDAGPGDVTWAFEWDVTLAPGASLDVIKDKRLSVAPVPEPATAALLGLALLAFRIWRRR